MNKVQVHIFNQSYAIGGELGEAYIRELAEYVDAKMKLIAGSTSTVDTQKVATFAALAIADELYTLRKEHGERDDLLKEQAERCLTLVERALKQTE
jgi:cell division protein ZapA